MNSPALTDSIDLDAYQWKNRLIIAFSPTDKDPRYLALKASIDHQMAEIKDRDIVFIQVLGVQGIRVDNQAITYEGAEEIRNRFGIPSDRFEVLLIGKDGGVKLQKEFDVDLSVIFSLIDTMPMRQQETRDKK